MDKSLLEAIEQLKVGKEEGFNKVYSETYNHVYFRAKSYMKDEEDTLDLVQIVYVEAYRNIVSLQEPEALYGWLDGITYRQGMKQYRKKRDVLLTEEGEGVFETLETEDISSMPELTADQKETSRIIRELIEELPVLQKIAMIAYYFDNMSVSQIAEIQECSEGTVKSRLNYGRKYLKDRIEEKEKKEGYRIHVFTLPTLYFAIKMMSEDTTMTVYAAQGVYNASCAATGLTAGTISGGAIAGSSQVTAAGGAQGVATGIGGQAAGLGAKFAALSTGVKALVIASALTVGTASVGAVVHVATNQPVIDSASNNALVDENNGNATILEEDLSQCIKLIGDLGEFASVRVEENTYCFPVSVIEQVYKEDVLTRVRVELPEGVYIKSFIYGDPYNSEFQVDLAEFLNNDDDGEVAFRHAPEIEIIITLASDGSISNAELDNEENNQDREARDFTSADVTGFITLNKLSPEEEFLEAVLNPTRTGEYEYTFYADNLQKSFVKEERIGCDGFTSMPEGMYISSITFLHGVRGEMECLTYDEDEGVLRASFVIDPSANIVVTVAPKGSAQESEISEEVQSNEETNSINLSETEKMQITDAIAYFGCMVFEPEITEYVSTVRGYIKTMQKGDGVNALPCGWTSDVVTEETVKAFYEDGFGISIHDGYMYDDYGVTCNSELTWDVSLDYFKYDNLEVVANEDGTYALTGTFIWGAEGEADLYSFEATAVASGNPNVFGGLKLTSYVVNE